MDIHITRKGEQFGPYPEEVARQYLQDGTLAATDLAWHAGADGWKPLAEVLGVGSAGRQWHYSLEGAQYGPVDETEIIQLIQSAEMSPGTPVCQVGGKDWQPARNHGCFQVEVYPKAPSSASKEVATPGEPPPEPTPPAEPTPPPSPASSGPPSATPAASGPPPATPVGDSAGATASDADEFFIARKGQQIGPTTRAKAEENFAAGKLVPTDWGWHDGMDEWKPLYEVLGMEVPAQPSIAPAAAAGKPGKGKKVAMIVGIVVLLSGLVFAGITYGPDLVAKISGGSLEKSMVVGTYTRDGSLMGDKREYVYLENGVMEIRHNGKKIDDMKWKISNGEIHTTNFSGIVVYRVNKDGSITAIAHMDNDGKRVDFTKAGVNGITYHKIK